LADDKESDAVRIGRLRWRVTLVSRDQVAQVTGTGIDESLIGLAKIYADIQPIGALTFWGNEQTDGPFSHRIFLRWVDYLDQTFAIVRTSYRADGQGRTEIFRVRRIKELGGRKRFVLIEAELEKVER
jgi:head-tail adaptor